LKLKRYQQLSEFAFNFNLRRYTKDVNANYDPEDDEEEEEDDEDEAGRCRLNLGW
jgi:hypothetical protein